MSADGGIPICPTCGEPVSVDPFGAAGVEPSQRFGADGPALSVVDIVFILRANPKAALQAVREAKIAGPWRSAGTLADGRYTLEGREAYTISILSELHPHCPTRGQLDQAAKADGWILVDG